MADPETRTRAEKFAERLAWLGPAAVRPMFGAQAIVVDEAMVAFLAYGETFLRVDDAFRDALVAKGSKAFAYERDGKRVAMKNYFSAPASVLADDAIFRAVLEAGFAAARAAKKKRRRKG